METAAPEASLRSLLLNLSHYMSVLFGCASQNMDNAVSGTALLLIAKKVRFYKKRCYQKSAFDEVETAVPEASLRSLLRNLSHFMSVLFGCASQNMDNAVSSTA